MRWNATPAPTIPPPMTTTSASLGSVPVTLRSMTDDDDIAIAWDVLRRGTPVISRDGVEVGTVRDVHNNAREHIFDGIVVKTPNGNRFVDAPEVARITLRQVTLNIDAVAAAGLPPPRRDRRWWRLGR